MIFHPAVTAVILSIFALTLLRQYISPVLKLDIEDVSLDTHVALITGSLMTIDYAYTIHPFTLFFTTTPSYTCTKGGCSGIGLHTALQLYLLNATVILGCRDANVARAVCKTFEGQFSPSSSPSTKSLRCLVPSSLDLASFESVRNFASQVPSLLSPLPSLATACS